MSEAGEATTFGELADGERFTLRRFGGLEYQRRGEGEYVDVELGSLHRCAASAHVYRLAGEIATSPLVNSPPAPEPVVVEQKLCGACSRQMQGAGPRCPTHNPALPADSVPPGYVVWMIEHIAPAPALEVLEVAF